MKRVGVLIIQKRDNFGATVVDAMAHGKPVITSTKTPWKVVADNKCGWWVDNEVGPLSAALRELFSTSDLDLDLLGQNGRALVEERYTWSAVCDKMLRGYEEVVR